MLYESKQTPRTPRVVVTPGQLIQPKLQQPKQPTHNAATKNAWMKRPGLQSGQLTPSATAKGARMMRPGLQNRLSTPSSTAKNVKILWSELQS